MKTGNLKKILSIAIITIVLALTITTIVLAVVPKKLYDPLNQDFITMSVWRDGVTNMYAKGDMGSEEQNNVINDILELHDKSLKDNVLSSIFQGTGKYNVKVERYGNNDVSKTAKADGVLSLVFSYKTEQKLTINGEEYYDANATVKTVSYSRAVMVLNKSQSFEESTSYLCDADYVSNCQLKFIAHQSEIWDYIVKLEMSQNKA